MDWSRIYQAAVDWVIILIFGGILYIPLLMTSTQLDLEYSETEKRSLVPFPDLGAFQDGIVQFTKGVDAYYQDHFGLREWLIGRYHRELSKRFNIGGSADVVVGEDGWFFYTGDDLGDDMMGRLRLDQVQLAVLADKISATRQWLENRGVVYLPLVAPNKQSIYHEYLPRYYREVRKKTRLDQVVEALNRDERTAILDLRPALLEGKQEKRIYDKTDTHWNRLGAYFAYKEILRRINELFPEVDFTNYFAVGVQWQSEPAGDLTELSAIQDDYSEERPVVFALLKSTEKSLSGRLQSLLYLEQLQSLLTVREDRDLRVLVLHDSFINPMKFFLSESFAEVLYIWKYYDRATLDYLNGDVLEQIIDEFRPDIVIEEVVERHLDWMLPPDQESEPGGRG